MTIATETRRAGPYSGNGSTQVFAFSFKCYAAADLVVVTTTSGVDTVKTLTTHYTVSLNSNQNTNPGGSITMLTAPASGTTLVITSDQSYLQELSLVNAGAFLPEALNDAFDKQTIFHQQNRYDIDRSLRGAISDDVWDRLPVASERAGGLLGFDAVTGQPEIADFGTVEALAADINTVAGIAAEIEIVAAADVDIATVADNIAAVTEVADWIGGGGDAGDIEVIATGSTTARTLADWFQGMERGTVIPPTSTGYFTDRATAGAFGNPLHFRHRILMGDGADDAGETVPGAQVSWLSGATDHYLVRSAQLLSISPVGGSGGIFATRTSDKYDGESVWAAGQSITAGNKRGYGGRLYTATTSGTTGATPLTHTSGNASDGGVSWDFTQYQYRTPMASARVLINDLVQDSAGCWADYIEAVRESGAGTTYAVEIALKNKGTNVTNDSYNKFPEGSTLGMWFAAGGDSAYGGSPANPSTAAIHIGAGASTWNTGIVFEDDGLTDRGSGVRIAMAMGQKHRLRWFVSSGTIGGDIDCDVTANNERTAITLNNRVIQMKCQDALIGTFESAPAAGTAPDNYVANVARGAGSGYVEVLARGTSTDIDLQLGGKGAGLVRFGTHTAIGAETVTGFITIKDAGGTTRKLAVVS